MSDVRSVLETSLGNGPNSQRFYLEHPSNGSTHQPPIIVGGGSLNLYLSQLMPSGAGGAPFTYLATGAEFGRLTAVRVTHERTDIEDCIYYGLPSDAELWLWTQVFQPPPQSSWAPLAPLPNVTITGIPNAVITRRQVQIISDVTMGTARGTNAQFRPWVYAHGGYGGSQFRIGAYAVVASGSVLFPDSTTPQYTDRGAEGYRFYLGFEH